MYKITLNLYQNIRKASREDPGGQRDKQTEKPC